MVRQIPVRMPCMVRQTPVRMPCMVRQTPVRIPCMVRQTPVRMPCMVRQIPVRMPCMVRQIPVRMPWCTQMNPKLHRDRCIVYFFNLSGSFLSQPKLTCCGFLFHPISSVVVYFVHVSESEPDQYYFKPILSCKNRGIFLG